jgi:hypothetical protein
MTTDAQKKRMLSSFILERSPASGIAPRRTARIAHHSISAEPARQSESPSEDLLSSKRISLVSQLLNRALNKVSAQFSESATKNAKQYSMSSPKWETTSQIPCQRISRPEALTTSNPPHARVVRSEMRCVEPQDTDPSDQSRILRTHSSRNAQSEAASIRGGKADSAHDAVFLGSAARWNIARIRAVSHGWDLTRCRCVA